MIILTMAFFNGNAVAWGTDINLPKPFEAEGYVHDVLGNRASFAYVWSNTDATIVTDSEGYWHLPSLNPRRTFTAAKEVNNRRALAASTWAQPYTQAGQHIRHDFFLFYQQYQPKLSPTLVRFGAGSTIEIQAVTYAPQSQTKMIFIVSLPNDETVATGEMTYVATDSDGFSTWTHDFVVPTSLLEGRYWVQALAVSLADGLVVTGQTTITCCRSFFVDASPPTVSAFSPTHTNDATPTISALIRDSGAGVDSNSISMLVDSEQVPFEYDEFSGTLTATPGSLSEGSHDVVLAVSDTVGNRSTEAFDFVVDLTAPEISFEFPVGTITTRTPLIGAFVRDDWNVDGGTVQLSLTGLAGTTELNPTFNASTGTVSYQVPEIPKGLGTGEGPLLDGQYFVQTSIRDLAGNVSSRSWIFEVRLDRDDPQDLLRMGLSSGMPRGKDTSISV